MYKRTTFDLSLASLYRFPAPLPAGSASLELWESAQDDAGPFTQELRLMDERGNLLCTRTFYSPIDLEQKAG